MHVDVHVYAKGQAGAWAKERNEVTGHEGRNDMKPKRKKVYVTCDVKRKNEGKTR